MTRSSSASRPCGSKGRLSCALARYRSEVPEARDRASYGGCVSTLFDFELPEGPHRAAPGRPARRRAAAGRAAGGRPPWRTAASRDLPDLLRPATRSSSTTRASSRRALTARAARARPWPASRRRCTSATGPSAGGPSCARRKKLAAGDRIRFGEAASARSASSSVLDAAVVEKARGRRGRCSLRRCPAPASTRPIERVGHMPLPPYIAARRPRTRATLADYQTAVRRTRPVRSLPRPPACISPTASSAGLARRGIDAPPADAACRRRHLPARQGRGHARPPDARRMGQRQRAGGRGALNETRARGGRIVAVGTTIARLLESAAGADGMLRPFAGETSIFITPGYRFRAVDVADDQLPPAALDPVHAGRGLLGPRDDAGRLRHAIARGLPLLQLRRCLPALPRLRGSEAAMSAAFQLSARRHATARRASA